MRRLRQIEQVAFHCLRIVLHVCVAISALGQVQRRIFFPFSKLLCTELVWREVAVADAALVGALLPSLFLSMCRTLRQFRGASNAFGFFCDFSVFSQQGQPVGVECRDWQMFATHHALYFCCPTSVAFRLSGCIVVLPPRTQACWIKSGRR